MYTKVGNLSKCSRGEARLRTTYSNNPANTGHQFLNRSSDDFKIEVLQIVRTAEAYIEFGIAE